MDARRGILGLMAPSARRLECAHCGTVFVPPARARPGPTPKYCGRTCRQRAYELRSVLPDYEALRREVRTLRKVNRQLHAELRKLGWTRDQLHG
jgi:hypothetical protein